ncbi:beta-lactamase family protein [Paenibacillus lactis]|uniref:beta-lactamase family protein n=1 Tax=Paenibacillus lactis TaxID=228574 RepID=UPI001B01E314|nr:beta-lactamase family protein [Paenibacillus lactis]GIO93243.1 hypothetical protein J31TS3_44700 [Paenibacillus lactis]
MKEKAGPSPLDQMRFDRWMAAMTRRRNIFGAVMCVENQDRSLSIVSSGGEMKPETPFFIASVTKLYVNCVHGSCFGLMIGLANICPRR